MYRIRVRRCICYALFISHRMTDNYNFYCIAPNFQYILLILLLALTFTTAIFKWSVVFFSLFLSHTFHPHASNRSSFRMYLMCTWTWSVLVCVCDGHKIRSVPSIILFDFEKLSWCSNTNKNNNNLHSDIHVLWTDSIILANI